MFQKIKYYATWAIVFLIIFIAFVFFSEGSIIGSVFVLLTAALLCPPFKTWLHTKNKFNFVLKRLKLVASSLFIIGFVSCVAEISAEKYHKKTEEFLLSGPKQLEIINNNIKSNNLDAANKLLTEVKKQLNETSGIAHDERYKKVLTKFNNLNDLYSQRVSQKKDLEEFPSIINKIQTSLERDNFKKAQNLIDKVKKRYSEYNAETKILISLEKNIKIKQDRNAQRNAQKERCKADWTACFDDKMLQSRNESYLNAVIKCESVASAMKIGYSTYFGREIRYKEGQKNAINTGIVKITYYDTKTTNKRTGVTRSGGWTICEYDLRREKLITIDGIKLR
jgi:hypothetical protein